MTTIEELQRMEVIQLKSILNSIGVKIPDLDYRSSQNKLTLAKIAFDIQEPEKTESSEDEVNNTPLALEEEPAFYRITELDILLKNIPGLKHEIGMDTVKFEVDKKCLSTTLHQSIKRIIKVAEIFSTGGIKC